MLNNKISINCLNNRKTGTSAIVYKSDPERYIIVTSKGKHLFRTLRELNNHRELYFNAIITGTDIQLLDGSILRANTYTKNLAYTNMYELNSKFKFHVDKSKGITSLIGYSAAILEQFRAPNFLRVIGSYSLAYKNIGTISIDKPLLDIESNSFKDSSIDLLEIRSSSVCIEQSAFKGCKINTLKLYTDTDSIPSKTFQEANIENLDLTRSRVKSLNYKFIHNLIGLNTIRLHPAIKDLDIDALPISINKIITTNRELKIQCKDKDKLKRLRDKLYSISNISNKVTLDIK